MRNISLLLALLGLLSTANATSVMIIDTATSDHSLFADRVKNTVNDGIDHGTHVAGIILFKEVSPYTGQPIEPLCPELNVTVYSCNYRNSTSACLSLASMYGVRYINISLTGNEKEPGEFELLKSMTDNGVQVVVAAGNDSVDISKTKRYPASYKYEGLGDNFHVVTYEGGVGNTGPGVLVRAGTVVSTITGNRIGKLTGSSMASPTYLHELLMKECKQLESRRLFKLPVFDWTGVKVN